MNIQRGIRIPSLRHVRSIRRQINALINCPVNEHSLLKFFTFLEIKVCQSYLPEEIHQNRFFYFSSYIQIYL